MTPQFGIGVLLTLTMLPLATWRLHRARLVLNAAEGLAPVLTLPAPRQPLRLITPAEVPAPTIPAPVGSTPPGPAGAGPARQAVPPAPGTAPDLPDVTPVLAGVEKAGQVRRGGPPCHGCHCCGVYATRIAAAHTEIDRLRIEILTRDAEGLRVAAQLQTGHEQR